MTELSSAALANLQTFASAGLVICLVLSGAFTALAFVTYGEQERRFAAVAEDRVERISKLLGEAESARRPVVDEIVVTAPEEDGGPAADAPDAPDDVPVIADLAGPEPDAPRSAEAVPETAATETASSRGTSAEDKLTARLAEVLSGLPETGPARVPPEDVLAMLTPKPALRVAADEAAAIAAGLAGQAGSFSVEIVTAPATESRLYAMQLADALRRAGLDARGPLPVLTTLDAPGVLVSAEAEDGPGALLLGVLQTSGLPALPPTANSAQSDILVPDETDVRVYVGDVTLPREASPSPSAEDTARLLEDA